MKYKNEGFNGWEGAETNKTRRLVVSNCPNLLVCICIHFILHIQAQRTV